ncbi:MAG: type II toxin-antitoxin system mRNA interferase toxin, RelE/StbE family [Anaerolineae bacterium]|nr:type II toxin-antitoxin system mRNA interferase toxin, RelE/StbE family [Anaerolineae bacterium]MCB0230482.1 type II toxin-antitoxin system mRNA interferase toxin, RelE/StbE family [Anaerolineae bacterium]MCB0251407.1 type II toxin-antitoxin system mRNA interferase toxin, RelE/StbE family [Anaerolineae bacterium]MCO5242728.1 type II toxin-antitoxin system mRNA interferase toxin, RelE/StbE family [Anaerolineae bacterium]HRX02046.1 type II toxin-antitoxin system mRNA interferase toxin, RelE/St
MRKLVASPKFERAFRKFVRRDQRLRATIEDTLRRMESDVFAPDLGTHKLSGTLYGLWACSCGYDCRIIFSLERDEKSGNEVILLLDIGTHDEVY